MGLSDRLCLATHTVELGGKFGVFEYDSVTESFLRENRPNFDFEAIRPVVADPDAAYAREVVVDLDSLEPHVALPGSLGNAVPVSQVAGIPVQQVMIGSCANGRVQDLEYAARILKGRKVARGTRLFVQPASWKVFRTCMHNGLLDILLDAGAQVLNPGCHLCIGLQGVLAPGENGLSSCTRNFKGRGGAEGSAISGGPRNGRRDGIDWQNHGPEGGALIWNAS